MQNINTFGFQVRIVASMSFPLGFTITEFADDADPFDSPGIPISETAMDVNGNLYDWSKAMPILASINVGPNTQADKNLQIIANNNRPVRGKLPIRDVIQLTVTYPDGSTRTQSNGRMVNAPIGNSVASAGRLKSKKYDFAFEGTNGTGS